MKEDVNIPPVLTILEDNVLVLWEFPLSRCFDMMCFPGFVVGFIYKLANIVGYKRCAERGEPIIQIFMV